MTGGMLVRTVQKVMEYEPTLPKRVQRADVIRERVGSGEYPPRHLIPEVRLEQEFGVVRVTVGKATGAPRSEGPITATPGMGSFVKEKAEEEAPDA